MKTRDDLGDWIWDDRDPLDPDPLGDPLSEGVLAAVARQAAVASPVESGEAQVAAPDDGVPPAPAPPMPYVPRAMARRHWEGWSVRSLIITGLVVVTVLVAAVIPQLLPDPRIQGGRMLEQEVRLVVLNGVGVPGVGEGVAEILVPEGFRLMASSNASMFDLEETRIVASSSDDLAGARQARDLLGVGRVQVGNQTGGLADVTVVVGRDFGRP